MLKAKSIEEIKHSKDTGRKPVVGTEADEFTVVSSEYADDTGIPFCSRRDVEEQTPYVIKHFDRWGMEVHAGTQDPITEEIIKESKSEILFCAAPARCYLDPKTFDPPLTTSESAVLMQVRPLFIDLAIAAGIQPSQARALLPYVD